MPFLCDYIYLMMENKLLFHNFTGYVRQFYTGDPEIDRNQTLKEEHSLRVVEEASAIAREEHFTPRESGLLQCAALFHDISRFEQFKMFRTFDDRHSFDHGDRSYEILQEHFLLPEELSGEARQVILTAVRYHNKIETPETLSALERKILLATRDADKIDIMQILIEHLKNPENPAIVYKLADNGVLSDKVRDTVLAGRLPAHSMFESSLDFIAAKFAWAFDLNSRRACRVFLERRYMQEIRSLLPEKPDVLDLMLEKVLAHLKEKGYPC